MEILDLLDLSIKKNASDLHLSPGLSPILRINGDLEFISIPELDPLSIKHMTYRIMDEKQQHDFENNLELDFSIHIPNSATVRVSIFKQSAGIAAVFRLIPEKIPSLDELEMPPVIKQLLDLPNGLILITGPTGSGKSTTLAAMIEFLNLTQSRHVITIEDPIEFTFQSKKCLINQRQVHRDTRDFAAALRSALRADPDVIFIGELRDLDTIRLALTAAETGHLVIATLHTSSAPRAVNRIIDVFSEGEKNRIRNLLSESLQAVIYQTLLKKMSGGRVAALEIMLGTSAIRNLIREDKVAQMNTVIQTGTSVGMCTLDQYLKQLMSKQIISLAEAKTVLNNA